MDPQHPLSSLTNSLTRGTIYVPLPKKRKYVAPATEIGMKIGED
jgi:hypothetical protein